MSLSKRIALLFKAKASKALDRAEDPRETLDFSYQQQRAIQSGKATPTARSTCASIRGRWAVSLQPWGFGLPLHPLVRPPRLTLASWRSRRSR